MNRYTSKCFEYSLNDLNALRTPPPATGKGFETTNILEFSAHTLHTYNIYSITHTNFLDYATRN